MENEKIKQEVNQEADDFLKALKERDRQNGLNPDFPDLSNKYNSTIQEEMFIIHGDPRDEQALRYNQGKLSWSMVDFDSLEGLVRVLEYGAKKYSKNNWKKGMPVTQVTESLMRHLFAFLNGENIDPESGCRHISHVMCNTMFLEYILREKPHFDDRENQDTTV